jgi:hypothetical protein
LDLDGTTEGIRTTTDSFLGFANNWTISLWFKSTDVLDSLSTVLEIGTSNIGNVNRIVIQIEASGQMSVRTFSSSGGTNKDYDYNGRIWTSWNHWVLTWAAGTMQLYLNGVAITPDVVNANGSSAMTDTARRTSVGEQRGGSGYHGGQYHSLAWWNTPLAANEVTALYLQNSGDIRSVKSANILQWTGFGYAAGDLYHSYVGSINVGANSDNLDDTDIVVDSP